MTHLGTIRLETERLILRRFEETDTETAFHVWTSDPKVTKFLHWKHHTNISQMRTLGQSWLERYEEDPEWYHWVVVPKEVGFPIGTITAVNINNDTGTVEMNTCIGSGYWGLGYITEAFAAVIEFFFEEVHANRIEAKYAPDNKASGRVLEKCGLTPEGTLRSADRLNTGITDICVCSILAEDYF
ncbi:GNAT family N-acetyltransferase [Ruminococcus sp.]|uniref:GNAT family N-acetyltransferase n=1 Tax=Ruminococcus sp. TaxID=41978 RepID=UPI001B53C66C|nr:GNAT family N-acetyltransferase [Ruminococcus sp.]MBP5432467.1 GNAT family N-acetyltransferase [Ruminococcus sp.]